MSGAPVYEILAANAALISMIPDTVTSGIRVYPAGAIPQNVLDPTVATFQTVTGSTLNVQSGRAPMDYERIQIDSWANDLPTSQALADAIRTALEDISALGARQTSCLLSNMNGHDFDPETHKYRVSMDFDFWTLR